MGRSATLGPVVWTVGASSVFLASVLAWAGREGIPPGALLRDPAQVTGIWPFTGLVSHLGVLILWSSVAICLLGATLARDRGTALFLLLFGVLGAVIALDDLFMLHEYFWPRQGVPTRVSQVALGVFGATLLLVFRRRLVGFAHVALHLAIVMLCVSLAVDLVVPHSIASTVVEDTAKFTGYALWACYWAGAVRDGLVR